MKKYNTPMLKVMNVSIQSMMAGSLDDVEIEEATKDRDEHLLDGLFD